MGGRREWRRRCPKVEEWSFCEERRCNGAVTDTLNFHWLLGMWTSGAPSYASVLGRLIGHSTRVKGDRNTCCMRAKCDRVRITGSIL